MKLTIAYLLALYLQRVGASPTLLIDRGYSGLSTTLGSHSNGALSNSSEILLPRSGASGDVEMGGMNDQDHMRQGTPPRSPSPEKDPVLPELTDAAAQQLVLKGAKMYSWMGEANEQRLTQLLRQDNKLRPDQSLQSRFVNYPQDLTDAGWGRSTAAMDARLSDWPISVPLIP